MRNFQQKRRWRNIIESRPVLALLSILVLVFAWSVIGFMGKMQETSRKKEIVKNKIAELEKEKEKLSFDIDKLKSYSGIEENVREKFGLAKDGEGVIVIVEDKNPPAVEDTKSEGFFSFFKNWFK